MGAEERPARSHKSEPLLIIGASAAGASAAIEARRLDPELPITLLSGEHKSPYARPSLMYLFMGKLGLRDLSLEPEARWDQLRVERVRAWATGLERSGAQRLVLAEGSEGPIRLPFSRLLIATGARPRRLSCPGADLEGVCGLWGLHELAQLSSLSAQAREALVVGGGLIGAELSEMLLSRGLRVTQLVREARYAPHLLTPAESALVSQELSAMGVDLRLSYELESLHGARGRVERAQARGPHGAQTLDCQLVAAAIGAEPELSLGARLGLSAEPHGLLVNERFETSSAQIYAAGDCATVRSAELSAGAQGWPQGWPQGWVSAQRQGRLAARAMLGAPLALEALDRQPELIPLVSRFGRLTHARVGPVIGRDAGLELQEEWAHPRRPARVSLFGREGQLSAISALGVQLEGPLWRARLLSGISLSSASALLPSEFKGLKRVA